MFGTNVNTMSDETYKGVLHLCRVIDKYLRENYAGSQIVIPIAAVLVTDDIKTEIEDGYADRGWASASFNEGRDQLTLTPPA